jgi:hypothetical protein
MITFKEFVEEMNKSQVQRVLDKFLPFASTELGIEKMPPIHLATGKEAQDMKSFGCWDGEKITLCPDNRHPMDVMRTLAHELVHYTHGHTNGEDGSDDENEANAKAGVIMRRFARANPDLF